MGVCGSYLYNVKDDILVETVQDALCDTVVAPRPMDQQELLQIGELPIREREIHLSEDFTRN